MNRRALLLLRLLTLVVAGCGSAMPPPTLGKRVAAGTPFTLDAGTSIALTDEPLTFALEEWVDDRVKACDPYVDGKPSGKGWFPMHRYRFVFNKIAQDEYAEWFYDPVDTSLYADYLAMVQRPMCLAEIKAALDIAQFAITIQGIIQRAGVQGGRFLRDVGDHPTFRDFQVALVLMQLTAQQGKQAGFTSAIRPHGANTHAGVDL